MTDELETHCIEEGVEIMDKEKIRSLVELAMVYLQKGKYRHCFRIINDRDGYRFIAYPGPAVVDGGRAEHEPLHFHAKSNQGRYHELRIRTSDFEEMDSYPIPKKLRMIFGIEELRVSLVRNTKSVYETGRLAED